MDISSYALMDNYLDKMMVLKFLENKLKFESPFRIYSFVPTTGRIITLFMAIVGTFTIYVVKFEDLVGEHV